MTNMTFTVRSKNGLARPHNYFQNINYHKSHPYAYTIADQYGWEYTLLSRRNDYKDTQKITIDCSSIGQSNFYLDHSAVPGYGYGYGGYSNSHTGPTTGEVNSDVIVKVKSVATKNGLTEVTGEIFYFNPKLRDLPPGTLRDAFRDSAKITVTTAVKEYYFAPEHNYIFEKLKDVQLSQGKITAIDKMRPPLKAP